jgi:DNA-binding NarL/FixJ family response regulator
MVRILIADDHQIVRMGVKALIASQKNWSVCGEAENGQEAILKAFELQPDLVILDISMPIVSGVEAARKIREFSPASKIVILTMHDMTLMQHVLSVSGAEAYVSKDAHRDDLLATIARLLADGKKKPASTVEQNPKPTPNQGNNIRQSE